MTIETLTKNKVISRLPKFWGGKRNGNNGSDAKDSITILFGSETGNSEFIAKETCKYLKSKGVKATCKNLFKYKPEQIVSEQQVLLVVSTHGEGDPPDAAEKFYHFLFNSDIHELSNLKYSVCALGDSSYDHFCKAGMDIDCQLAKLGAKRITPCTACDVNFREEAVKWISKTYEHISGEQHQVDGLATADDNIVETEKWYTANITDKFLLNNPESDKETWHLSFTVDDPAFDYQPGDCIGILPKNDEMLVTMLLNQLGLTGSEMVNMHDRPESIFNALQLKLEITSVSKMVLQKYARLSHSADLRDLLEDPVQLKNYLAKCDVLDMVTDYPATIDPQQLVDVLAPLQHRLYSIASSPNTNKQQVDITVRSVKTEYRNRLRKGACSVQMGDRFQLGEEVRFFVKPNNNFRLPEKAEKPVVMIGAGTGIAPFRAFLHHRKYNSENSKNWLFFGDRRKDYDFLYENELKEFQKDGLLTQLDLAFSRDEDDKKYVQHKMFEQRHELLTWLDEGCSIYVCGLLQMAQEVKLAMIEMFKVEYGWTQDKAEEYLHQLKAEQRYCEDAY